MGAYECWCAQKGKLREELRDCTDGSNLMYAVRHTLAQVEQTTMAEQTDDVLRQQTGILFGCCKTAVNLLEVPVAAKVWTLQSQKPKKRAPKVALLVAAGLVQLAAGLYGYGKGDGVLWTLAAAAAILAGIALLMRGPKAQSGGREDGVKVTLQPQLEKLFSALDAQMQGIDRYVNDFTYLNEQAAGQKNQLDTKTISLVSDMLEALYDSQEESRQTAEEAAERMLSALGLMAVPYSLNDRQLFTVLPSKGETQTLVPAIVSAQDRKLLKQGTAAVRLDSEEA